MMLMTGDLQVHRTMLETTDFSHVSSKTEVNHRSQENAADDLKHTAAWSEPIDKIVVQ